MYDVVLNYILHSLIFPNVVCIRLKWTKNLTKHLCSDHFTFANNFLNVLPCSCVKFGHIEDYVGSYCQWFWEVRREETLTVHTKTLRCTHDSCWHTVNTRWQSLDIDPGCRQEQSKICVWAHTLQTKTSRCALAKCWNTVRTRWYNLDIDLAEYTQSLAAKLFERGQQPPVSHLPL
jgi:hypothetical protein